jgi:hypothetical protein
MLTEADKVEMRLHLGNLMPLTPHDREKAFYLAELYTAAVHWQFDGDNKAVDVYAGYEPSGAVLPFKKKLPPAVAVVAGLIGVRFATLEMLAWMPFADVTRLIG